MKKTKERNYVTNYLISKYGEMYDYMSEEKSYTVEAEAEELISNICKILGDTYIYNSYDDDDNFDYKKIDELQFIMNRKEKIDKIKNKIN